MRNSLKVGIGFVTGRKHFQHLLKTYIYNWLEHGILERSDLELHVYVAYDLKYFNTQPADYRNLPASLREKVAGLHFLGETEIRQLRQEATATAGLSAAEAALLLGEGYARKRNLVTYAALRDGMDRLLFIDDDEYPMACLQNNDCGLLWQGQSVLGTHLQHGEQAHVTHGHHCGYISPVPAFDFNEILQEEDFRHFIEAISNEIISWEKVRWLMQNHQGITFADPALMKQSQEVQQQQGLKCISGANLCFNLEKARDLPPFYNPPGARGEDTFLSTALEKLTVLKVPCYTFHDGFLLYKKLLSGVMPAQLQAISSRLPAHRDRFIRAALGWMRYKPLLVYLTDTDNYKARMQQIQQQLQLSVPLMNRFFHTRAFSQLQQDFDTYRHQAPAHAEAFAHARAAWQQLVIATQPAATPA